MDSPNTKDNIVLFSKLFKGLFLMFNVFLIFDAPMYGCSEHGVIECKVSGLNESGFFSSRGLEFFECITKHI